MTISQGLAEKDDDPGFEIIHLSFRKKLSESLYGGPVNYYIGNIVFRLTDEDAINRMKYYMQENEELRSKVSILEQELTNEEKGCLVPK